MQDERTQAELGEAMAALDILMAECKGNAARRANLEKQVQLSARVILSCLMCKGRTLGLSAGSKSYISM